MTASPPRPPLLPVYLGLLVLLTLTAVSSSWPLGAWKMPVALVIAAAKTALIFGYFMRLRYEHGLVRAFAATGFFWLGIIGVLTAADYFTRTWLY